LDAHNDADLDSLDDADLNKPASNPKSLAASAPDRHRHAERPLVMASAAAAA
jgi:hypothetical protein